MMLFFLKECADNCDALGGIMCINRTEVIPGERGGANMRDILVDDFFSIFSWDRF
jgi:hypothetical protein